MCPTASAVSAPPIPARAAAMTRFRCTTLRTEAPMYSTRSSLSRMAGASRPRWEPQVPVERGAGDEGAQRGEPVTPDAAARADEREPGHRLRDDVEAVGRPERRRLHQQSVEDHREREAQHGEEDGPVAREQHPDDRRDRRRRDGPEQHHGERVADAEPVRGGPRGVGADGEVEPLAEGDEAGPHEEEQPERHEPLRQRDGDEEERPLRQERREHEEHDEAGREQRERASSGFIISFAPPAATNRPRGRKASTSAITR